MKILVLNCGSSSIKYQFLDMNEEPDLLAKGIVESIGLKNSFIKHTRKDNFKLEKPIAAPDHDVATQIIIDTLLNSEYGVISDIHEIKAVGHRVVHGGEAFSDSVLITQEVKDDIEHCIDLAPLHNPANLNGILAMEKLLPNVPQVAVFDTAFHQTMPANAYLYALPYRYYEEYKLRRYGFHGTSHKYVAEEASKLIGKDFNKINIITCHLGNGASITAIKNGESIDTSMGLSPEEGLVMGTRCGDIGLGVMHYIMKKENMSLPTFSDMINKRGGLLGISGLTYDMRELRKAYNEGHERARLAIDIFVYKLKKYIGAYAFILGKVDLIVFTGGIGENAAIIRAETCKDLEFFGLEIDPEKNIEAKGIPMIISKETSRESIVVMPTNEELVIAKDTQRIVFGK